MTAEQRDREIKHWERVLKKYESNNPLTRAEKQQRFYAEWQIEQIREQWRAMEKKIV